MGVLSKEKRIEALNALMDDCKFYIVELTYRSGDVVRSVYAASSMDNFVEQIAGSIDVGTFDLALALDSTGKYFYQDSSGGSTLVEEVNVEFSLL